MNGIQILSSDKRVGLFGLVAPDGRVVISIERAVRFRTHRVSIELSPNNLRILLNFCQQQLQPCK